MQLEQLGEHDQEESGGGEFHSSTRVQIPGRATTRRKQSNSNRGNCWEVLVLGFSYPRAKKLRNSLLVWFCSEINSRSRPCPDSPPRAMFRRKSAPVSDSETQAAPLKREKSGRLTGLWGKSKAVREREQREELEREAHGLAERFRQVCEGKPVDKINPQVSKSAPTPFPHTHGCSPPPPFPFEEAMCGWGSSQVCVSVVRCGSLQCCLE